jgi:dynein intermediate chain 2
MEHAILQNNACNIYENYFEDIEPLNIIEQFTSKTLNVYKDYLDEIRSVSYICWQPDEGIHFASTHCRIEGDTTKNKDSYVWDV